jgi:hypothetical protein
LRQRLAGWVWLGRRLAAPREGPPGPACVVGRCAALRQRLAGWVWLGRRLAAARERPVGLLAVRDRVAAPRQARCGARGIPPWQRIARLLPCWLVHIGHVAVS